MEAENSLDDFNRTECSRSRSRSRYPPGKKLIREEALTSSSEKKLSDTRRSRSRSRYPQEKKLREEALTSSSEKKLSDTRRSRSRSRSPLKKKLSDTRYKDEKKSEKKSKKKSEKKLSDTRYKEEKKSSSSDDDVELYFSYGHKYCRHGITRKDLKPLNKYFKQDSDSEGYEASFQYGGVFPCDVDTEGEFLNETCRKCIAEYNKKHNEEPDYELLDVVMATKKPVSGFNYYITFRARQVHLPDVVKTFQAQCYRGLRATNNGEIAKFLKSEDIKWTEEGNGWIFVIPLDIIDPKELNFVKKQAAIRLKRMDEN